MQKTKISEESVILSTVVPVGVVRIVKMKTIRNYVSSEHPTTSREMEYRGVLDYEYSTEISPLDITEVRRIAYGLANHVADLVAQIDQRWHICNSRIHIFPIVNLFGTADLELVHDWRNVVNRSTGNLKYLHQDRSKHSFGRILKRKEEKRSGYLSDAHDANQGVVVQSSRHPCTYIPVFAVSRLPRQSHRLLVVACC